MWIESVCTDEKLIDNIMQRNIAAGNPDYIGVDSETV